MQMSDDEALVRAALAIIASGRASTSHVQRQLQIGYRQASTLIERLETAKIISAANHAGKRTVLVANPLAGIRGAIAATENHSYEVAGSNADDDDMADDDFDCWDVEEDGEEQGSPDVVSGF